MSRAGIARTLRDWLFAGVTGAALVGLAVELALRVLGPEAPAWPSASREPGIRPDPLLGPLLRPGWRGQWPSGSGHAFGVEVDERGFRSTGWVPEASPGRLVAFLGDSCTFGGGVATPETYVAQLSRIASKGSRPPVEFVNAAMPGHTAVSGRHMLRERVLPLEPVGVVLAFSANNAFRFTLQSEADRYRFFAARKLVLHSRALRAASGAMAKALIRWGEASEVNLMDRELLKRTPLAEIKRNAMPGEFEQALRGMVADARAAGAWVVFLVFPRAMQVSDLYPYEDAARQAPRHSLTSPQPGPRAPWGLVEVSCLDQREPEVPERLASAARQWRITRPADPGVRARLREGARAYLGGEPSVALEHFAATVQATAGSPLALYDAGVTEIALGNADAGLALLREADRLACSIFLRHQRILWELAVELSIPVVDLVLAFQADAGAPLFLDPAHPTPRGHRLAAEALWPVLEPLLPRGAAAATPRRAGPRMPPP